jgi:transposase
LRVVRIVRPKYTCRNCNKVVQAAAPERLIAGGLATPALLAQVMVSKYGDHTPLYRQSQILARHGVDLGRSTLAGWVGGACWWLEALHGRLCKNVFASDHLFADDTPIPVLDPGRGRTKTGRLWVYAREQRPWSGPAPPAAVYLFAPDRKAERPVAHLTEVPIQFRDPRGDTFDPSGSNEQWDCSSRLAPRVELSVVPPFHRAAGFSLWAG